MIETLLLYGLSGYAIYTISEKLYLTEKVRSTILKYSTAELMTQYSIKVILKHIDNLSNLHLNQTIDMYKSSDARVWRSRNELPAVHGAKSYDIFIIDEQWSRDFNNQGHCTVYDMFKLEVDSACISPFIINEIEKNVTAEQFEKFTIWCFMNSYFCGRNSTSIISLKESPSYHQIEFDSKYDEILYELQYSNLYYDTFKEVLPSNSRELVNRIA